MTMSMYYVISSYVCKDLSVNKGYVLFCSVQWAVAACTTIHKYPIFSTRFSVIRNVYTGYHGTSEIEHGLCACMVDNPPR